MRSVEKGISLSLVQVIRQTTAALVFADAERLEELARSCPNPGREEQVKWNESQVQTAGSDLRLLALTLEETRANLAVIERLHQIRLREFGVDATVEHNRLADERRGSLKLQRRVGYGDN